MSTPGPETTKKATFFSNLIGTSITAISKLLVFQPIDTLSTNAMMGPENHALFKEKLKQVPLKSKLQMLYNGIWVELFRKIPSYAYRYPVQSLTEQHLNNKHGDKFVKMFGGDAKVATAALSGAATAVTEPFLFLPFDTVQVHQQIHQKPLFETFRNLSIGSLYRSVWVTSLLRNLPSGVMLFGGSAALNKSMNNENQSNHAIDFCAKTAAGLGSVVCSQPGDVLKVKMQGNQWSFSEAIHKVPVKQFFTNGSMYRIFSGGFKMGFGFFLAERAMKASAQFFGKDPDSDMSSSKNRRL